jgi:hypothetical protein
MDINVFDKFSLYCWCCDSSKVVCPADVACMYIHVYYGRKWLIIEGKEGSGVE